MALIFLASGTPGSDLPKFGLFDVFVKKGGHMLGYALLTASFFHALNQGKKITKLQIFVALLLAILYATTDEFHQFFTPGRSSSIIDVGIDSIGCLAGIIASYFIRIRFADPDRRISSTQT
jgi:VanZ family protein